MFDVRSILDNSFIYNTLQNLVLDKKHTAEYVNKYIRPKDNDYVLDVGCGPADILDFLPKVKYYGFDLNPRYVAAAKRKYGNRGTFFCEELTESRDFGGIKFDLVLANKVLHHLNDGEAIQLFKLAKNCLKSGGRLITSDGCHFAGEKFISKILLSWDRGKYIRDEAGYLDLARKVFKNIKYHIRGDLSNIPGNQIIICCVNN